MIAVGGKECLFVAVVLPGEGAAHTAELHASIVEARKAEDFVCNRFVDAREDAEGRLWGVDFPNAEKFNFAFDIVDAIAKKAPDKLAMLHVDWTAWSGGLRLRT